MGKRALPVKHMEQDPNEEADYIHKVDRRIFRWIVYTVVIVAVIGGAYLLMRAG